MYHNIKVDLIYYNTPADYEMEFHLAGCCRMRLLSDKVAAVKPFLASLARAVKRSKVVIAAGPLFEDGGLFSIVAHAIGYPLVPVDCSAFGLQSDAPVTLIEGATPLITENGMLAGCIVESGPQTMILLSENKTLRKSVMASLVHPYIADLAMAEAENTPPLFTADSSQPLPAEPNGETVDPATVAAADDPDAEESFILESIAVDTEPEEAPEPETAVTEETTEETTEEEEPLKQDDRTDIDVEIEIAEMEEEEETEEETKATEEPAQVKEEPAAAVIPDEQEPEESFILDMDGSSLDDYGETPEDEDPDFYIDTEPENKKKRKEALQNAIDLASSDIESEYHYEEPDDADLLRPRFRLPILILFTALLVILALLVFLIIFLPLRSGISPIQYLQEIFSKLSGKA